MQGKRIRYHPAIGLSISNKNNDFKKISKAPLIGKNDIEPFGMASPFVMYDKEKNLAYVVCKL